MSGSKQQPIIYIDSENFLFKVSSVLISHGLIKNRDQLTSLGIRFLLETALNKSDCIIRYYAAKPRLVRDTARLQKKTQLIIKNRRIIRSALTKQKIDFVNAGRIKLRDGDICHQCKHQDQHLQEKGVDVRIAVDMIKDTYPDRQLYLLSSDTDLIPAVEAAREGKAKVIYIGFPSQLTKRLTVVTDSVVVLREAEIIKAFKQPKK